MSTICMVSYEGFSVFLMFLLCGLALSEKITNALVTRHVKNLKREKKKLSCPPCSKTHVSAVIAKMSRLSDTKHRCALYKTLSRDHVNHQKLIVQ